jgi:hypothetical protein
VAIRRPWDSGAAESALVFEQRTKTATGEIWMRRYRCDAKPEEFGDLAPFCRIWQGKCRDGALPRWKNFSFEDFRHWHRYVALSDISAEDADPRFRIFGSGASELVGANLTGKKLTEGVPSAERDGVIEHFAQLRDHRLIGFLRGDPGSPGREHIRLLVIELPLVDDSGAVVQILHGFQPVRDFA